MEAIIDFLKLLISIIATVVTWIFGTWDISITVLIIFMSLDYLTGMIKAYINKQLSSSIGVRGLAKKSLILIVLVVAVLLDRLINTTWVFRTLVCYFYIVNEGLSILENCGELGLPLPQKLIDALLQLKDKEWLQ